jgi:hypothetical protein
VNGRRPVSMTSSACKERRRRRRSWTHCPSKIPSARSRPCSRPPSTHAVLLACRARPGARSPPVASPPPETLPVLPPISAHKSNKQAINRSRKEARRDTHILWASQLVRAMYGFLSRYAESKSNGKSNGKKRRAIRRRAWQEHRSQACARWVDPALPAPHL